MPTLRTQPHWDHPRKEYDILTTPTLPVGCAEGSQVFLRSHSRPCAKPQRRIQPLQAEAGNAQKALVRRTAPRRSERLPKISSRKPRNTFKERKPQRNPAMALETTPRAPIEDIGLSLSGESIDCLAERHFRPHQYQAGSQSGASPCGRQGQGTCAFDATALFQMWPVCP